MPSMVVEAMRYDTQWRVLTILFRESGEVYRYYEVPRTVWEAFVAAPSKGTYLNERFKAMGFRFERAEGVGLPSPPAGTQRRDHILRWPELPQGEGP